MWHADDMSFDEEQFIKENLSFLIESDEEFSENSGSSSGQSWLQSNSFYCTSPISSKVNETWSLSSSGSIVSPREAPSTFPNHIDNTKWTTSWNTLKASKSTGFSSSYSLEDIYFGQPVTAASEDVISKCNDKYIKSSLYKVWSDPLFNKPENLSSNERGLNENKFSVTSSFDSRISSNNAHYGCVNLASKIWPYSTFTTPIQSATFEPKGIPHFSTSNFPYGTASNAPQPPLMQCFLSYPGYINKNSGLPLLVPSIPIVLPPCGAEEALNKYFSQQCNVDTNKWFSESDLSFKKDFPVGRTSTPIPPPPKFVAEDSDTFSSDVAGAFTTDIDVEQPKSHTQNKKQTHEPVTLEDFAVKEDKLLKPRPKKPSHNHGKQLEFCRFCYKNGELSSVYMTHVVKAPDGTTTCPILRNYVCDLCGATGGKSHTRKYCPLNREEKKTFYFRRLSNGVITSSQDHK